MITGITNMSVGIDIVSIQRFKDKPNLIARVLSTNEFNEYKRRKESLEFVAGHFAAKEAFLKANRFEHQVAFKRIEILYFDNGRPYIYFEKGIYDNVSISHDGGIAIAIVNIEEGK